MLFLAFVLCASRPATAQAPCEDPVIPHERYRLDNGLEVILHPDKTVPIVAVSVWYHVGARNETPGKSGFAHLFEHMLFQGARHIGEDAHFEILRKVGGTSVNGTTNFDRTNYFEVVPSHELETALWLESDRMGYFLPLLTEKSLKNQIDVVRNERRQNYDTRAYRGALFPLFAALYPEGHPHRQLVIGLHEHLERASLDEVRDFYRTWYVPANATLTLAGDFEVAEAKALVHKWFGSFPKSERPPAPEVPRVSLAETRRLTHPDRFAKLRQLQFVWHGPGMGERDEADLEIAAHVLGATGTGRLYKLLVVEEQLAQSVDANVWSFQGSGLFFVTVTLKTGASLDATESLVREELARLQHTPILPRELARAVIAREAGFVWGLESLLARAELLQQYNHYLGAPDAIGRDLARFRSANPERVRDTVKRYLERPRVELVVEPDSAPVAARNAAVGAQP